jgi:hypothetical protein
MPDSYRYARADIGASGDRLTRPLEIGSEYSRYPIPGQQSLAIESAGYRESNQTWLRDMVARYGEGSN